MARVVSVSAANSTVTASPLFLANDGVESATITVTVRTNFGDAMPNRAVTLSLVSGTGTLTQPVGTTNQAGQITGSVVSSTIGTMVIKATVLSTNITEQVSIAVSSSTIALGAGPNAPAWSGKTVYTEELFTSPIPVVPNNPANAAGFRAYDGFDTYYGRTYVHKQSDYPVVSTPIGTKPVLRVLFPGSTKSITAAGQSTDSWDISDTQGFSVKVSGTWSGTLAFETSVDNGANWSAKTLTGYHGGSTGTSTTVNGAWDAGESASTLFRVRASSWTSGTAVVDVGCRGGYATARFTAGTFNASPTRVYTRCLIYVDPTWTDNGNAGTKFTFFSQEQGNNHYINLWGDSGAVPTVALQGTSSYSAAGSAGPANGNWLDCEFILEAGTAGVANGVFKAWINGTLLLNVSNVPYFEAGDIPRFLNFWFDATYGGGRRPPPRTLYVDIAGWYRESAT